MRQCSLINSNHYWWHGRIRRAIAPRGAISGYSCQSAVKPFLSGSSNSGTPGNDLGLLAEREDLAALRADVIPRALTQVVFLGEGGMIAGLSAPLLLEDNCALLLHRDGLGTKFDGTGANLKAITDAEEAVDLLRRRELRGHRGCLGDALGRAGKRDDPKPESLELVVPNHVARRRIQAEQFTTSDLRERAMGPLS